MIILSKEIHLHVCKHCFHVYKHRSSIPSLKLSREYFIDAKTTQKLVHNQSNVDIKV